MKRVLFGLTITTALLVIVTGSVFAQEGTTPLTGMVQSVVLETDPETSVITAVVTLVDALGETQVVRISLETAVELGLVDLQQAVVEIPEGGIEVTIEATDILIHEDVDDGCQHPSPQHYQISSAPCWAWIMIPSWLTMKTALALESLPRRCG